ncbi:hypothetical protein BOX15_Mlig026171g1 [Macrostomum lignano]|uniref:Band 7 domain-containing protein n=1 Tax=Macrostomum lignano TaxID=282301 RepID=A0A267EDB1_9PLAT|nr:hypothetical protein BOX15_Mlig026171g1 [Macrostomum lignano]
MVFGCTTCKPNEALIITGCCYQSPVFVTNGWKCTIPGIHKVQRMPLNVMKITVESPRIYAKQGVTISVTGLSEVRINGWNQDMLAVAFDNFLGKKEHEIEAIVKEKLEAQQSAIIRQMSIDEIYMDRRKFCTAFFNAASADLERIGISVLSYRLEEVSDEDGYLKALGEARLRLS